MASGSAIAIEIGRRRFRALFALRDRNVLRVKRVIVEDVPAEIDPDDVKALGDWVASLLSDAGFPKARATIALAREHVVLKRLSLPTVDDDELPEMTRLALQRDLPFEAAEAVIDFVPVDRDEQSTTVMAVAAPGEVLEMTRRIVGAAGLGVERIALRAMGSSALIESGDRENADCVLAVDVTGDGVEFCIVEKGAIRFSRAAEMPADEEPEPVAEAVMTETRRTWMSYRIVEGTTDVQHAVVMAARGVAELTAGPIGEMLKTDAAILDGHPQVDSNGEQMDRVWPLAGLLLEPILNRDTIDFAKPRRTVDRAAKLRRRVVITAGLGVVTVLAAWTIGKGKLADLESDLDNLKNSQQSMSADVARYQRDTFTLGHLKRWELVDAGWLDHVLYLNDVLPSADEVVLDSWVGSLSFRGVRYDKKSKEWSTPKSLAIVIDGEARNRPTADKLRERLVQTEWLVASSSGSDAKGGKRLPFGFVYRLHTDEGVPPDDGEGLEVGEDEG